MAFKQAIHHGLTLEQAHLALDKAMEAYSARFSDYSPHFEWKSETRGEFGFKAKGLSVDGSLEIIGDKVDVELEVPFILRVFRGKSMEVIEREMKKWIEKVRNGELT